MDGTGDLYRWFEDALPPGIRTTVVRYPRNKVLGSDQLFQIVKEAAPQDEPYVLVAESFSGPFAIQLAATNPLQLKALVLCCTYSVNPLPWFLRWLAGIAKPRFFRKPLPPTMIRRGFLGPKASASLVDEVGLAVASVLPEVLAQRATIALKTKVEDKLGQIQTPTLCLSGRADRILGKHCQKKLEMGLNRAKHVALDGPHLLFQQCPDESVEAILGFLASNISQH